MLVSPDTKCATPIIGLPLVDASEMSVSWTLGLTFSFSANHGYIWLLAKQTIKLISVNAS